MTWPWSSVTENDASCVASAVKAVARSFCGIAHLQDAVAEQALHQIAVAAQHAGMVHPDAARNQLLQLPVQAALASSEPA